MIRRHWKLILLASLVLVLLLGGLGAWMAFRSGIIERVYVYREGRQEVHVSASSRVRSVSWSIPPP